MIAAAAVAVIGQIGAVVGLMGSSEAEPEPAAAPASPSAPAPSPSPSPSPVARPRRPVLTEASPLPSAATTPPPEPSPTAPADATPDQLVALARQRLTWRVDAWPRDGQDLAPARALVERALAEDPAHLDALILRAQLEHLADGPAAAMPWARRAAREADASRRGWAQLLLARTLYALDQDAAALAAAEAAWEARAACPPELRGLVTGWVLAYRARERLNERDFGGALELLEQADQAAPAKLALVELLRGYVYHLDPERQDLPRALAHYTAALRGDGRLADAWFYRGVAHFDRGSPEHAAADLDRAFELAQTAPHRFPLAHLHLVRGLALESLGIADAKAYDDLMAYLAEAGMGDAVIRRVRPALARLAGRLQRPDPFAGAEIPSSEGR